MPGYTASGDQEEFVLLRPAMYHLDLIPAFQWCIYFLSVMVDPNPTRFILLSQAFYRCAHMTTDAMPSDMSLGLQ